MFPSVQQPEYFESGDAKALIDQYRTWVIDELRQRGDDALVALFLRVAVLIERLRRQPLQNRARIIFSESFTQLIASLKSADDLLRGFLPYIEAVSDSFFLTAEATDFACRVTLDDPPLGILQKALKFFERARDSYADCFRRCREVAHNLQQPALALPMDKLLANYVSAINRIAFLRMAICIVRQKPEVRFELASQFTVGPYFKEFPPRQVLGDDFPDLTSTMEMLTATMDQKFIAPDRAMAVFTNVGNLAVIAGDHQSAWSYYAAAMACGRSGGGLPYELEEAMRLLTKLEE
ncbi:MAG: hypothetical protein HY564_02275 [Candidatus Jacksonbacteria bacterium]|nr:hypothetical protein [Candidatus Jacksonbacteria bacterium]